jgi:hypothetical protein
MHWSHGSTVSARSEALAFRAWERSSRRFATSSSSVNCDERRLKFSRISPRLESAPGAVASPSLESPEIPSDPHFLACLYLPMQVFLRFLYDRS